jgi:hypothetical protein
MGFDSSKSATVCNIQLPEGGFEEGTVRARHM